MKRIFVSVMLFIVSSACSQPVAQPDSPPSALVSVATATRGVVSETLTVYGDVAADPSGQRALVAPVEAVIATIAAPLGSRVQAGSVVAKLSPSPATQVIIAQAAATAGQADAAVERARRLRADGLASDADVEATRAAATSADAALASLRGRGLALSSPIAGTVTRVGFATGDLVPLGAAVAVVTADGDVRARFGIDPLLARMVSPGDPIRVTPTSGGAVLTQNVDAIDPVVDPVTRLASIIAIIPGTAKLAPGEPLQGDITVSRTKDGISIPYEAVLNDGGQLYVYTVTGGIAHRTDIITGGQDGDRIAILSGISEGDEVVTAGAAAVSDGLAVRTQPPAHSATTSPSTPSK